VVIEARDGTSEVVHLARTELSHLEERAARLAREKAHLQLLIRLMGTLGAAQGLDEVIEALLRNVLDAVGGTNVVLCYFVDEELHYADVLGLRRRLSRVEDELVKAALERREPVEREHAFSDTKMLGSPLECGAGGAYTSALPLVAGADLIGVIKLENLHVAMRSLCFQLHPFFDYAASVLKNEVLGRTRLKRAFDEVSTANVRLEAEIGVRLRTEVALQAARDELERRVRERTEELQTANKRLLVELAERRRAEAALRESSEEIRDLYDRAPCGYHSLDRRGVIVQMNDTELAWLGYAREDVVGKLHFTDLLTPPSARAFEESFPQFRVRGWVRDVELELARKDGSRLPVLLSATAVTDADGNYVMSRSTLYDISLRKKAAEAEHLLSTIVESSEDAILAKDLDGVILTWNQGAARLYGYSAEEAIGRNVGMLIPPEQPDELARLLSSLGRGERLEHYTAERIRKDGTRLFVSITMSPIRDEAGRVIRASSIARDITDRKRAEDAMRAAKEAAEDVARAKSRFLDIAAHELRTPTTVFSAVLQLAQRQLESGKAVDTAMLYRLRRNADRLSRLVVELLDVSRLERGTMVPRMKRADVVALVSDCVEDHRALAPGRPLVTTLPGGPVEVEMDPVRIQQALSSLIDNALRYSPPESPIEIGVEPSPGRVRVSVRDRGPGISEALRAELFRPLSRGASDLEERSSGLGLGLYLCRGIVELHGGTVGVTSEPGAGSTFWFELPRREEDAR
jgi:PAS domain S-box-containing protein